MAYDDKTFKATKIFNIEFIEDLNDTLDDITTDVENLEQTFEEEIETLENKIPEKLVYDASSLTVYSNLYGDVGSQETLYYFGFNNQTNAETFFGKTMVELGNLFKNNGSITFNNLQVPVPNYFQNPIYLDRTLHCVYPYAIDYKEALGDIYVIAQLGATSVDTAMNFSSESISVKSSEYGTFLSRMGLYLLDYVDGDGDPRYSMIFYFIYDPVVDLGVVPSLYDPFPELAPPSPVG